MTNRYIYIRAYILGGFYMTTSTPLPRKANVVMKGPPVNLSSELCMSFFYNMYGEHASPTKDVIITLSLSSEFLNGTTRILWLVRSTLSDMWRPARATLPVGLQRLVFTLSGSLATASLDDILVIENNCNGI